MRLHHLFKDCTSLYGQTSRTRKHRNPSRRSSPTSHHRTTQGPNHTERYLSKLFPDLGNALSTVESSFISILNKSTTSLPVIGQSLSSLSNEVAGGINQVIEPSEPVLANAVNTNAISTIQNSIANDNPGALNVVVNPSNFDITNGNIEITLDLKESATSQFNFATGLPSLPFTINVPKNGLGPGTLTASFIYTNLDFGLQNGNFSLWINKGGPSQVQLQIGTSILAGASFSGNFGLFNVTAKVPTDNGIGLSGSLVANVTGTGLNNIGLSAPTLQNFVAQANLHLNGTVGSSSGNDPQGNLSPVEQQLSGPHVAADFHLSWDLSGSDPSAGLAQLGSQDPDVQFNNVEIGIGSVIGSELAPILGFVQDITAPLDPVLELLDAPIPGLSDIGAGDVSLLRLASIINDEGVVPQGIAQVVSLAIDVAQLLDAIDNLHLDANNDIMIDVGSFDLTQNLNGQDLTEPSSLLPRLSRP